MKKQKNTIPKYVTKEMLKKELSKSEQRLDAKIDGVEQRLDAKIDAKVDSAIQSMKDYTDSRFTQLDTKIDDLKTTVKEQGKTTDRYFNGIVQMIEGLTGRITDNDEHLKNHEKRITKLEKQRV